MQAFDQLPSAYFALGSGSGGSCDNTSCSSGYHVNSDPSITSFVRWDFIIKVEEFVSQEEKIQKKDLRIGFQTFSQGTAGCWEDALGKCLLDVSQFKRYFVDITSDVPIYSNETKLKIHPNPFTDEIKITLPNRQESEIKLNVFDSFGKKQLHEINPLKGEREIKSIQTQNWQPGIYFLEMSLDGKVVRKKVVKVE